MNRLITSIIYHKIVTDQAELILNKDTTKDSILELLQNNGTSKEMLLDILEYQEFIKSELEHEERITSKKRKHPSIKLSLVSNAKKA